MGSEIYFLFSMKFWWKMSLAIVFSELTCTNGTMGGVVGGWEAKGSF